MRKEIHHIKKQVLDFQFSTKSSAAAWQKNFAFKYQDELERSLTSVFDLYDDRYYFEIDKIELDLGEISEEEMASKVRTELFRELGKLLKNFPDYKKIKSEKLLGKKEAKGIWKDEKLELIKQFTFFLQYGALPWNSTVSSLVELEERLREMFSFAEISKNLRRDAVLKEPWVKQRLYSQFSFEFSKGLLSTFFKAEVEDLNKLRKSFTNVLERLRNEKSFPGEMKTPSPKAVIRWVALHSHEKEYYWQGEFLRWNFKQQPGIAGNLENIQNYREILTLDFKAITVAELELGLYRIFLEILDTSKTDLLKKEPEHPKRRGEKNENQESVQSEPKQEKKDKKENDAVSEERSFSVGSEDGQRVKTTESEQDQSHEKSEREAQELQRKFKPGFSKEKSGRDKPPSSEEFYRKSDLGSSTEEAEISSLRHWEPDLEEEPVASSISGSVVTKATDTENPFPSLREIYINFTGQVLVWPYLVHFFKKLEFIGENKIFPSPRDQERAVLLLGYIATGNPHCEEHQLVVSKLLCGWPLHKPLVKKLVLRDDEMAEADVMLENLIRNWRKLQNTSIEGLRETFFCRKGKLIEEDENWKLLVEQKGVDILLDFLPYTISVIKLPWVKKAIMVDWA